MCRSLSFIQPQSQTCSVIDTSNPVLSLQDVKTPTPDRFPNNFAPLSFPSNVISYNRYVPQVRVASMARMSLGGGPVQLGQPHILKIEDKPMRTFNGTLAR
jgi:hypothetical protein